MRIRTRIRNTSQAASVATLRSPLPVTQARSRKTRDALIAAAWRLLAARSWQVISVNDLVKAAGCSVGAFYSRFADKDALLEALASEFLQARWEQREKSFAALEAEADYAAHAILDSYNYLMKHRNFWNAALIRGANDPVFWEPFRASGLRTLALTIQCHERSIRRKLSDEEIQRISFAFQMANGVINNGIVNRPGPLLPGTPAFKAELVRGFKAVSGLG